MATHLNVTGTEYVTINMETAIGGTSGTAILIPVLPGTFKMTENRENIFDDARRGIDTMNFGSYRGVESSEITWDGVIQEGNATVHPVIGFLLHNLMSSTSTRAQIESLVLSDHRIQLGQLVNYMTVTHASLGAGGGLARQAADCRVSEITIRWNAGEGRLEYSVTLTGQAPTLVTEALATDHTGNNFMAWRGRLDIMNIVPHLRVISGEWTISRELTPWYATNNTRAYADIYAGPLNAQCSAVLELDAGLADYSKVVAFETATNQTEFTMIWSNDDKLEGSDDEVVTSRRFALSMSNASLGGQAVEIDNSNINNRLLLTAVGLNAGAGTLMSDGNAVTASLNSPVQAQIFSVGTNPYPALI